jgi:hypothetical protein
MSTNWDWISIGVTPFARGVLRHLTILPAGLPTINWLYGDTTRLQRFLVPVQARSTLVQLCGQIRGRKCYFKRDMQLPYVWNFLFALAFCYSEYVANIYQSRALSFFLDSLPSELWDTALFESFDV